MILVDEPESGENRALLAAAPGWLPVAASRALRNSVVRRRQSLIFGQAQVKMRKSLAQSTDQAPSMTSLLDDRASCHIYHGISKHINKRRLSLELFTRMQQHVTDCLFRLGRRDFRKIKSCEEREGSTLRHTNDVGPIQHLCQAQFTPFVNRFY